MAEKKEKKGINEGHLVPVYIPREHFEALKKIAGADERSLSYVARKIIKEYLGKCLKTTENASRMGHVERELSELKKMGDEQNEK